MSLIRITGAIPLEGLRVQLTLSDGQVIVRDLDHLLAGPVFEEIRRDPGVFQQVRVEGGTIAWPNGADLCPDVLIWGGLPPAEPVWGAA